MHWQTAATVNAFLQREGRLDRPMSLTLRHKIWRYAQYISGQQQPKNFEEAWKITEKSWRGRDDTKEGMIPMWQLDSDKCNDIGIVQILPVYEYNDSLDDMVRELKAAQKYPKGMQKQL